MLHQIRNGCGVIATYNKSWHRHHQLRCAHAAATPNFAQLRCPDCLSTQLLPVTAQHQKAFVFAIFSALANLDD